MRLADPRVRDHTQSPPESEPRGGPQRHLVGAGNKPRLRVTGCAVVSTCPGAESGEARASLRTVQKGLVWVPSGTCSFSPSSSPSTAGWGVPGVGQTQGARARGRVWDAAGDTAGRVSPGQAASPLAEQGLRLESSSCLSPTLGHAGPRWALSRQHSLAPHATNTVTEEMISGAPLCNRRSTRTVTWPHALRLRRPGEPAACAHTPARRPSPCPARGRRGVGP